MKELNDPAIKLFGMKIAFPVISPGGKPDPPAAAAAINFESDLSLMVTYCLDTEKITKVKEAEKDLVVEKTLATGQQDLSMITEGLKDQETVRDSSRENPITSYTEEEIASPEDPKAGNDDEIDDTNSSDDQKTLKKPDKILPCPRCESMDTKFCYYNNYNVNQPRYFCKSCQRYWTAGGTMRNVPVGAGRRKNKTLATASHCRHITISEARVDIPSGIHHSGFKTNGTVLSFGSDSRLCESMASVLNLASEKNAPNGVVYRMEQGNDDCSSGSSVTTSNSMEDGARNVIQEPMKTSMNGYPPQIPMLPGVPWPYPWNPAVSIPTFCPPPGYPMPFYPAPYWPVGNWSVPWLPPQSPTMDKSSPNSPNLGKHSREGDLLKPVNMESREQNDSERCVLIPKTLRIDDPDEAAKSSIWATLGIKNESLNRGSLFKGFQPNKDGGKKHHVAQASPALGANPAAMSRSFSFQENS